MLRSGSFTPGSEPILRVAHISKAFGGVRALVDASLDLYPGEIHALLGENGAGKSTLLKALAGVHQIDSGEITLNGEEFIQGSTRMSIEQGVAVIYQEPNLFPDLTLAENVFIGRQPTKGKFVDWEKMQSESKKLFDGLGIPLNPLAKARGLSIADQQIVEIAKALSTNAQVIVMDEPTAALSAKEVERLFEVARRLKAQNQAVVFVSHRLDEVFELCQRMTVMRDGSTVDTKMVADSSEAEVIQMMVGREVSELFPKIDVETGDSVLTVNNLGASGNFEGISFEVKAGEILGIAGLVGSGRSEIMRAIFGVDGYDHGTIQLLGKFVPKKNPAKSMAMGMALVPEDRRQQGLFMPTSIARNASITVLKRLSKGLVLSRKKEEQTAITWGEVLQLKFARIADSVDKLSGGNQQKVVLAKWLATNPTLLIVDEPTRGIDVGTKSEVHRLLSQKAKDGMAILMVSSELPEILGMSDRVIVMRQGRMVAHFERSDATPSAVIAAATGSGSQA
ncbi:MAG: sugar ABC transporter ATP-binding protein [Aquiluna sp.]|jgi:rhamnose transport system ATP-binding protein|tara:strand:- start:68 stop:1591 length:1524 start_codon:yes stop_codon:yes gene_type:complete